MHTILQLSQNATPHRKHRNGQKVWTMIGFVFALLVLSFLFLTPLVWLLVTALKDISELAEFPIRLFPRQAHWDNFVTALTQINFLQFAQNTFILSSLSALLTTFTCALVGFGFARLEGPGKHSLFVIMLSTIMLPPILTVIPTYIIFANLGFVDTYWPWVIWGLGSSPFLSFLFRQFFASIPLELEEAAIIDGCSYLRMFVRIFLPLSKPVIATSIIFSFTGVWGDYLAPSLLLSSDNTTLAVAMSVGYQDLHNNVLTNILAAGVIMYILPLLALFFFAQRYFVRGIVTTGLKG